jgi:hypothetical protein
MNVGTVVVKWFLFPALVLIPSAPCETDFGAKTRRPALNKMTRALESVEAGSQRNRESLTQGDKEEIPASFRGVDFKNFSYPTNFRKRNIRLREGSYEIASGLGGDTFELEDVNYADLTGEGKKQAVVQLSWLSCGVSCDGGSNLFYVYSIQRGRLRLLSRIETGSLAYTCGLRSFDLNKRRIVVETFRRCHLNGVAIKNNYDVDGRGGKFMADRFTRFVFEFHGRRLRQRERAVLSNAEQDIRNYRPRISINE